MSFMGFWAAVSPGISEDLDLLEAGLIGSLLIILRDCIYADRVWQRDNPSKVRHVT